MADFKGTLLNEEAVDIVTSERIEVR